MTKSSVSPTKALIQKRETHNNKFIKSHESKLNMSKEQDKVWRKEQLRQRNKEAAARFRNKKQKQLQELQEEVEDWKQKCEYLAKNIDFLEKSELVACKTNHIPLTGMTSEEQPPLEETFKAKVMDKPKSKYRNRYEPGKKMSKEREEKWVEEQRKQRNREAATRSRIKKQEQIEELKKEVEYWKRKHDCLVKRKEMLEKRSTLASKTTKNGVPSSCCVLTPGNKEQKDPSVPFTPICTNINNTISSKATSKATSKARKAFIKPEFKYQNRYKPPVQMSKEEEKVWRKDQLRQRNREAAARLRIKKRKQLQELEEEVEYWKRKSVSLLKRIETMEKNTDAFKTNDIPSLTVLTGYEKHTSSKATSKVKDTNQSESKYGKRYEPVDQMSKEEEAKWRTEQRRQRNKKAAAKSYIEKQEMFEELKKEVEHWKGKHDSLMKIKEILENGSTLSTSNVTNDVPSCVWTRGSEEQKDTPSVPLALSYGRNTSNIVRSPLLLTEQQQMQQYYMASNTTIQQGYLIRNILDHYRRINEEYLRLSIFAKRYYPNSFLAYQK